MKCVLLKFYFRYDVYEVEYPNLHYLVTVRLKILQVYTPAYGMGTVANWTTVSEFTLSPDTPSGRSDDGRVRMA